jgi:hypothetical protein
MRKARTLWTVGLAAMTVSLGHAATLVDTDFSKNADGWTINSSSGDDSWKAGIVTPAEAAPGGMVLQLVNDANDQGGSVWTNLKTKVPSFSFTVDMRFRHDKSHGCPADAAAMAFANADAKFVGGRGGNGALFGSDADGNSLEQFTALDLNIWHGQGLGSGDCNDPAAVSETFGWDVVNAGTDNSRGGQDNPGDAAAGGAKIGQVAMPKGLVLMNGGFYRIQWNADQAAHTMTAYITGLEAGKNDQFKQVKVLETKFPDADPVKNLIDFEGRWGITAATGGLNVIVEVSHARVDSPVIPPL